MGELAERLISHLKEANPKNLKQVDEILRAIDPVITQSIIADILDGLLMEIEELTDKTSFNIYLMIKKKRDELLGEDENE